MQYFEQDEFRNYLEKIPCLVYTLSRVQSQFLSLLLWVVLALELFLSAS